MAKDKVCVVIGAGDATGGAIARRFAREGYTAVVTRRSADKLQSLVARIVEEGGRVHPFGSDARDEAQVEALFRQIETEIGEVEAFVFNIGGNVRFDIRDTTSRVYRKVWECGRWRSRWRASWDHKTSMSRTSSSTAPSTPNGSRPTSRTATMPAPMRSSIPTTLPRPTGNSIARSAAPGPSRWISGRGRRAGSYHDAARSFRSASIMSMVGVVTPANSLRSAIESVSASISSGLPA